MKSLDTNTLLRLVLNDVPKQHQAVSKLIEAAPVNSYQVFDVVFFEMVWVLSSPNLKLTRADIAELLKVVLALPQLNCNRDLFETVLLIYITYSQLSFIDCCLSVYAELNGATPLLTFDQHLVKKLPKQTKLLAA